MIKLGIESFAKLIAFEKPVALTSGELFAIRDLIRKAGVKAIVSHQHRYGVHYRKVKEFAASGALGRVHTVYGTATGWMTHLLSHLIDYTCWFNSYSPGAWVMAQAAGRHKFTDNHPSPDYLGGFVQFANGVRGFTKSAPARRTNRKSRSGGGKAASARKARKGSRRSSPTAAGAP